MSFHIFHSWEEQQAVGTGAFIEIQFCKLPIGTETKEIVSVDSITNRKKDSLYIFEENMFYKEYRSIFHHGIYNNMRCGTVDIYGINYYAPSLLDPMITQLQKQKPVDYKTLTEWLIKAKAFNGFYILGI